MLIYNDIQPLWMLYFFPRGMHFHKTCSASSYVSNETDTLKLDDIIMLNIGNFVLKNVGMRIH